MGKFDNLNDSQLPELIRRVERLERASPMNNAAIGRGGIEVYDGGVIRITNGGLSVTGTATITGTLQADGTIAFTGTFTQSGPTTFTGDTKLNGPTHINGVTDITGNTKVTGTFDVNGPMTTTGTLAVEGVTTLKNDLNVTTGGKITAGNTKITPSASNGGVEFVSGGGVGGNAGSVVVKGSGNAGLITGDVAAVFAGATQINVGDGSVSITGLPTVSGVTSNLYMDPSTKQIKRIV